MRARNALRGLASATLSAALVLGGVIVVAPAANAEEGSVPQTGIVQSESGETPAPAADPEGSPENPVSGPSQPEEEEAPAAAVPTDPAPPPEGTNEDAPVSSEGSDHEAAPAQTAAQEPSPAPRVDARVVGIAAKKSLTVSVLGEQIPPGIAAMRAALIERGGDTEAQIAVASKESEPVSQNTVNFDLVASPSGLDRKRQYDVVLWADGSAFAPGNLMARQPVTITAAQWDELFGTAQKPNTDWNEKAAVGSMDWGIKESFRKYIVDGAAHGSISVKKPATGSTSGTTMFRFPQSINKWNPKTQSGTVQFAGLVNMKGHWDDWYERNLLYLDFANPVITVDASGAGRISVVVDKKSRVIATFTLGKAKQNKDGSVSYSNLPTVLTKYGAEQYFANDTGEGPKGTFYTEGDALDPLSFTVGADSKTAKPVDPGDGDGKNNGKKPKPKPKNETKPVNPASNGRAAGSLKWGISSYFAAYTTSKSGSSNCPTPSKHCAGGSIATSGVGGGYLFPQAGGGTWNAKTQTGSVQFSGVVSFNGYGMTMFQVANPTITVTGPTTATLSTGYSGSYGPSSVPLDLGSAAKTVGSGGEVTWSNVPVQGGLSGISSGQSSGFDSLTFTVGTASNASFGSSETGEDKEARTPAPTAPATTGITVLTAADKLKAGGRIELEASGFDPEDTGVLVVLYADKDGGEPILLDEEAKSDANGDLHWSGTLPEDATGAQTITLQGSIDAGAQIKLVKDKKAKKKTVAEAKQELAEAEMREASVVGAFAPSPGSGMALWEWWASAGGLVLIAACTTALAVRQRRTP